VNGGRIPERTSSTFDDASGLSENGISRTQAFDLAPDLVACAVRVNGRNAGPGIRERTRQALDVVPVDLKASGNNESIVLEIASCGSLDGIRGRRERRNVLLDESQVGRDQGLELPAEVSLRSKPSTDKGPIVRGQVSSGTQF